MDRTTVRTRPREATRPARTTHHRYTDAAGHHGADARRGTTLHRPLPPTRSAPAAGRHLSHPIRQARHGEPTVGNTVGASGISGDRAGHPRPVRVPGQIRRVSTGTGGRPGHGGMGSRAALVRWHPGNRRAFIPRAHPMGGGAVYRAALGRHVPGHHHQQLQRALLSGRVIQSAQPADVVVVDRFTGNLPVGPSAAGRRHRQASTPGDGSPAPGQCRQYRHREARTFLAHSNRSHRRRPLGRDQSHTGPRDPQDTGEHGDRLVGPAAGRTVARLRGATEDGLPATDHHRPVGSHEVPQGGDR